MSKGKVWLVGAGPGDPELFTLKGKKVLAQAEVVIYDALVGKGVLAMISPTAKCINAGKHARNHLIPQHEINRIIYEEAAKDQRVVRLKGGDPFMFGRGGEEAKYLKEHGMDYEIVPGVTSPMAVPAYNGIPVTHRDFTSSVHFITAHKKKDEELNIDFKSLVALNGTYVFLMGFGALESVCGGLLDAGIDKDMPAAVLSQGTTAGQRKVVATVSTLVEKVRTQEMKTPALIVVGEVCKLSEELSWREYAPLFGKRILVTRPRSRSQKMADMLRNFGAEVIDVPSIRLEPIKENAPLENAIKEIDSFSWIVFTSPAGVEIFFERLLQQKCDIRSLYRCKFAVIGQGTAKELAKFGIIADIIPKTFENEALAAELMPVLSPEDKVLIPRAAIGNPILTERLGETGAQLFDIKVYDTVVEESQWLDIDEMIESQEMDYVTFTSASTVHNFVKLAKNTKDFSKVNAVCIGRQTREAADGYGMKTIVANTATIESMCELMIEDNK